MWPLVLYYCTVLQTRGVFFFSPLRQRYFPLWKTWKFSANRSQRRACSTRNFKTSKEIRQPKTNFDTLLLFLLVFRFPREWKQLFSFRVHHKRVILRFAKRLKKNKKTEFTRIFFDAERIFLFDMRNAVPPDCHNSVISVARIEICRTKSINYSNPCNHLNVENLKYKEWGKRFETGVRIMFKRFRKHRGGTRIKFTSNRRENLRIV